MGEQSLSRDSINEKYELANEAFRAGTVRGATDEQLRDFLIGLASNPVLNQSLHAGLVVKGLTVNQILLERELVRMNKSNSCMQRLLMILAVFALAASIAQVWVAFNPPAGSPASQSAKPVQKASPTQPNK